MPFPTTPTNGQTASVNGKSYVYNAAKDSWSVAVTTGSIPGTLITPSGTVAGNLNTTGNLTVSFNASITGDVTADGITGADLTVSNAAGITGNLTVGGILTDNYYYANGTAFVGSGSSSNAYALTSGTAQASTSGTVVEYGSIPSWVKKITVMLSGVSTNGSNNLLIQLGSSGGYETSSYISTMGVVNAGVASQSSSGSGFMVASQTAARTASGIVTIALLGSNTWVYNSVVRSETSVVAFSAGAKTLAGTLDRVRVTSTGSTDAFDAGTINILYE